MIVSLIAAMSENRVIGSQNQLPWHVPEDLKYFKAKTKGHICIMGRKTFESVGSRPLPGRLNIVISRSGVIEKNGAAVAGVEVFKTLPDALSHAATMFPIWGEEIFICGGGEIYRAAMAVADRLYITKIHKHVEGEITFPEWSSADFKEVWAEAHQGDPTFTFLLYERVNPRKQPVV